MKEKSLTRVTLEQAKNLEDLTDWERIEKMSDEQIEQNALSDLDNQPLFTAIKRVEKIKKFKGIIKN